MQNKIIVVIVNISRREAMSDNSRKPILGLGGAPIPTKKVLKQKWIIYYTKLNKNTFIYKCINFTNTNNLTWHKNHQKAVRMLH